MQTTRPPHVVIPSSADSNDAALGTAANPLEIHFSGDVGSFTLLNALLATANATINVNSQSIAGANAITAAGLIQGLNLKATALTATRIPLVGAAGAIEDDAGLTYDKATDAMGVTGTIVASGMITGLNLKATSLTAARVPLVGAAGQLEDDAGLTYDKSTDALGVTGSITATGDLAAAGGFRQTISGWAGTLAASQTTLAVPFCGKTAPWIAPRAGSVMGVSIGLSAAFTGTTKTVVLHVNKNGSLLSSSLNLTLASATADTAKYVVAAKDAHTFAAGDAISLDYTSTDITGTPDYAAALEVEM